MKGECNEPLSCKWWVSTRTYTAKCAEGKVGEPVTVTRQARSCISQRDADDKAAALARREAEAELQCYFEATAAALTPCSTFDPPELVEATAQSLISPEDAYAKALAQAQQGAQNLCEFGIPGGGHPFELMSGNPLYLMSGNPLETVL